MEQERNGYKWVNNLVIRERYDDLGKLKRQICLLKRILVLAHEKFRHLSKGKVAEHIPKVFYCRSCTQCQRVNKSKPRPAPMVKREVLTVPFERVCVDLVGPMPKAKEGFQFILTCIDVASSIVAHCPETSGTVPELSAQSHATEV